MNIKIKTCMMLLLMVFCYSVVCADVIEDLQAFGREMSRLTYGGDAASIKLESSLRSREQSLFDTILNSPDTVEQFFAVAPELPSSLVKRFLHRLKFAVIQENRVDLRPFLEKADTLADNSKSATRNRRVVNIYGKPVDLSDGDWRNSPDGRRFWVSNEYPDIVLSPAEYKRYLKGSR